MDMGTSTMAAMATATSSGAAATTSAAMDMSGGSGCKISMLWNWYTVDSCFISATWHITSTSMFAGSCIGVILLVMSLEFLRRLGKEYDRYILRQYQRSFSSPQCCAPVLPKSPQTKDATPSDTEAASQGSRDVGAPSMGTFRPNIFQQMIRATMHMLQFSVAYFVMLLAMYYNGYFIICIIIGAWLGAFVFSWENVTFGGPQEDATVCCG